MLFDKLTGSGFQLCHGETIPFYRAAIFEARRARWRTLLASNIANLNKRTKRTTDIDRRDLRSEEHTSELQSQSNLVCRLLLEKENTCATEEPGHGAIADDRVIREYIST